MTTETLAELERLKAAEESAWDLRERGYGDEWPMARKALGDFLAENVSAIIADATDLAALRAREAARPVCGKTADGVEVRAGDRVYMSDNHREWYAAIAGTAMADGSYLRLVTDCYSTPEAARAAGEKT